jgi:hypothetical protein
MADVIYNSFKVDQMAGNINVLTDTIKLMLVTSAYVPNQDTHTKRSDITNEVVGAGYTAGGVTLTGKTVTQNNTNNTGVFSASNITISDATLTARGGVLYHSRGGLASADELLGYLDFGANISSTAADFLITFNANGILTLG